jgi:WD40 repeat protein
MSAASQPQPKSTPAKSWEGATLRMTLPTTATRLKFSADGKLSFEGGPYGGVHRWDIKTGKLQRSSDLSIDHSDILAVLSPDGQTYVYGGDVTGYRIGNFQSNKSWKLPQNPSSRDSLSGVVFSPDGQQIAIISGKKTIDIIR